MHSVTCWTNNVCNILQIYNNLQQCSKTKHLSKYKYEKTNRAQHTTHTRLRIRIVTTVCIPTMRPHGIQERVAKSPIPCLCFYVSPSPQFHACASMGRQVPNSMLVLLVGAAPQHGRRPPRRRRRVAWGREQECLLVLNRRRGKATSGISGQYQECMYGLVLRMKIKHKRRLEKWMGRTGYEYSSWTYTYNMVPVVIDCIAAE